MPTQATDPKSAQRLFNLLPWLILAGGLGITGLLWSQLREREITMERAEFALQAGELVNDLRHRITANADILRGVAGLFAGSDEVTRTEFHRYMKGLRLAEYYPGIQGIGYAELVPAAEKERHIAALRAQGLPDYDIKPPGDRDLYSAVIYIEPLDWRNRRAIGFDLLTEPVRLAATTQARDENQVVMSDRVTLKQETDTDVQAGVLIFAPVYRVALPLDTVEQRRAALRGWAYAAIRIKDMINVYLGSDHNERLKQLSLQIFGKESLAPDALLYRSTPEPDAAAAPFAVVRRIAFAGADWTLQIAPLPAYLDAVRAKESSLTVLAAGSLLSLALALISLILTRSHLRVRAALEDAGRANRALAERTRELADSEGRVRAKLEALLSPEGALEALELADIVDGPAIQQIMDDFFQLTGLPTALADLKGRVLVATGWQEICTRFHRVCPATARNCLESDTLLSQGIEPGAFRIYRCKNGMQDVATPIMVSGRQVGNMFFGQFIFDDEPPDHEGFRQQARRCGFDETAYLAAYDRVPRWSRDKVAVVMRFYLHFAELISRLSHANIRLARTLTQQQRDEEALMVAKDQAEAASRAKSVFLANMSHEIRTPLNAILGFAQVLGRDPDLNEAQRSSLTTIQRSGEHLLALINDILDMAKIEAGRMTVQTAPFDLARLLTEMETLFRRRAHDRGLSLTVEAAELPLQVAGDEMKLRQVLINLIGNAVKFTQAGGVTLRVERAANDGIRFSVMDTGLGIAPEELTRLFMPFTQTESGRSVHGGTGLGLALSHHFVQLMGGKLIAASTPGQGSCFSFTLPLPTVETDREPTTRRRGITVVGLVPGQPGCRILIVDDQADNREPLRALLNGLNPHPPVLEFREAADGQAAVAIWEAWQPHLIFMDMRMPVLSGEEATRRIKAWMAARPAAVRSLIVALTAGAFAENRDQCLACGCDEFVRKPFEAEDVFAILEQRVGLQFIQTAKPPAHEELLSPEAVAHRLADCAEAWRAALKDAVRLGDFDRIGGLVEQIRGADTALCEVLAGWAYNYDLEAFSQALSGMGRIKAG